MYISGELNREKKNVYACFCINLLYTCVSQVGRFEVNLISPDSKTVVLEKNFKDISSCCQVGLFLLSIFTLKVPLSCLSCRSSQRISSDWFYSLFFLDIQCINAHLYSTAGFLCSNLNLIVNYIFISNVEMCSLYGCQMQSRFFKQTSSIKIMHCLVWAKRPFY